MAREALIIDLPCLVKAHRTQSGERIISVEASNEVPDAEGDVIEQKALLDAAPEFIENGHIDVDHLSEIGDRLGLPNPESYIVGRPTSVKDLGGGRTGVIAKLFSHPDGVDAKARRYDAVWESIKSGVLWRASIYGFPKSDAIEDCRGNVCSSGATRFHIKALDWRSLALTRNPVNEAIEGYAKIITAKARIAEIAELLKADPPTLSPNTQSGQPFAGKPSPDAPTSGGAPGLSPTGFVPPTVALSEDNPVAGTGAPHPFPHLAPRSLSDALGQYHHHIRKDCPFFNNMNTTPGFKAHFETCCGMDPHTAEIFAHALMHSLLLDRKRQH